MSTSEAPYAAYLVSLRQELQAVAQGLSCPVGFGDLLHRYLTGEDATMVPYLPQARRRLPALLCLLACEACGDDWRRALPAAAAVESLLLFTLIHDDIAGITPCAGPACAGLHSNGAADPDHSPAPLQGTAQAINAGDALFALSNLSLGRLAERGVPPATVVTILSLLNHTELALTASQHLGIDLAARASFSLNDCLAMVAGKAVLTARACEMGALIASAPDDCRESLRSFGRHLGLAYCIASEVLCGWRGEERGSAGDNGGPSSCTSSSLEYRMRKHQSQAMAALAQAERQGLAVQPLCKLANSLFEG